MNQPCANAILSFFSDGYSSSVSFDLSSCPITNDSYILFPFGALVGVTSVSQIYNPPILISGTANIIDISLSGTIVTFTFDVAPNLGSPTIDGIALTFLF